MGMRARCGYHADMNAVNAEASVEGDFPRRRGSESACGLYIHTPFCETKCGYCDFYSVALKDRETAPLVRRIITELRSRVPASGLMVHTVFCGGGTPTLLPPGDLDLLLAAIGEVVDVSTLEEFTVEANPATVDDVQTVLLREHGVSRVSMGAQSFFPAELTTLERLHHPADIPDSLATLRRAGFTNTNLDLIFGIPGQTLDTWSQSLQRAIDLNPEHLSCYGLTYEPRTRLTALKVGGRLTPCDENLEAEMFEYTVDRLAGAGYHQYETSNYARPGYECRHNLIYWRNQPYIGVGPSAAGCYHGRRYKNVSDIAGFIQMMDKQGHAEVETETVDTSMLMIEMVMMQLRLAEGLSLRDFHTRCGVDPRDLFHSDIERFGSRGLIEVSENYLALTRAGRLVSDAIIRELASACGEGSRSLRIIQ